MNKESRVYVAGHRGLVGSALVRSLRAQGYSNVITRTHPQLDLADPTDPRVVGELKVPGFSTFIVPMDENHLLTVGQYIPPPGQFGPWGVQLSIFDVSDFAKYVYSIRGRPLGDLFSTHSAIILLLDSDAQYNLDQFTQVVQAAEEIVVPTQEAKDEMEAMWNFIDTVAAPTECQSMDTGQMNSNLDQLVNALNAAVEKHRQAHSGAKTTILNVEVN